MRSLCAKVVLGETPTVDAGRLRRETMRKWQCMTCGFIYDEAEGLPDAGIAAGTRWQDVREDWLCPECGTPKSDFEMVEI